MKYLPFANYLGMLGKQTFEHCGARAASVIDDEVNTLHQFARDQYSLSNLKIVRATYRWKRQKHVIW